LDYQDFESTYRNLSDEQLQLVLDDRADLLPIAVAALDREVRRRQVKPSEPPHWLRKPGSSDDVYSLEDYPEYVQLVVRIRRLSRLWYLKAISPFIFVLALSRSTSKDFPQLVVASLFWAMFYGLYLFWLRTRLLGYRCPQCSNPFGRGNDCFNCGFPRSVTK
jgi:hypothetical protein